MLTSIFSTLLSPLLSQRTREIDGVTVTVFESEHERRVLRYERAPKSTTPSVSLDVDEPDGEVTLGVCLPLVGGRWVTVYPRVSFFRLLGMDWESVREKPDGTYLSQREVRVAVHSGRLWWSIWKPVHIYHPDDRRRGSVSVDPLDLLYGEERFESRISGPVERIPVAMPERTYHASVTPTITTARRPRGGPDRVWTSFRVEIEEKEGVPVPGKGENAYDCGDDAIHAISVQAASPEQAVGILIGSALRLRAQRQGTYGWEPKAPEPAPAVQA